MSYPSPLKVLIHLHPKLDTLDFAGPLEILSQANHLSSDSNTKLAKAFNITITAEQEHTTSGQGLIVKRHISLEEAYASLADYDVLLIPGGASESVLPTADRAATEPVALIKTFASLPQRANSSTRYLFSVCTGSLFLAEAGVLDGLVATTHASYYEVLRKVAGSKGKTDVKEERFVVNKAKEGGSGLVVITAGGVSCGLDASLWLVGEMAGLEQRESVAKTVQYARREGVVL